MKLFNCTHCGQPVYFENTFCVQCKAQLGFDPAQMDMLALQPAANNTYMLLGREQPTASDASYKYCINKEQNVCNWLLPANNEGNYCVACNLNHTIPNLSKPDHWEKWYHIEVAKHRLLYSLLRFKLPVTSKFQDGANGILFDFLANENEAERLLTGHNHGLITLNIEEADDAIREMARNQMDEVYRTLLGHFRHEIGHYYWDRLINNTKWLKPFRAIFGDERIDYTESLQQHYSKSVSDEWRTDFISAYAASHPWEDWAETWAHYMHIVDTMETAYSFGMTLHPRAADPGNQVSAKLNIDPYTTKFMKDIMKRWMPLSVVMNSLDRSMGMKDAYPFVINEVVRKKLGFIHEVIKAVQKQ